MSARLVLLALGLLTADGVSAQQVVTSPAPDAVSVTVYRNPDRARGGAIDLRWLGGFALVTETRRVELPAGPATLRFEGVAGGIVPVSAMVTGLPGPVVEKNRDARLLSPRSLVDGTLGRRVTLRRTDRASGRARDEEAEIVSTAGDGVVFRTAAGVEALTCSGLAEEPVYDAIPAGLSAGPVLSITTRSPAPAVAMVTLAYLASGFDWNASYVATVAPDGRTLDLFAWLTLANANAESFPEAQVQAVAGRLNRERTEAYRRAVERLELRCYPLGTTTSDLGTVETEEIIVTGSRVMATFDVAAPPPPPPEDLGDLKLYRVPEPVTVEANGQKQVALLARSRVPFERVHRLRVWPGQPLPPTPARIELKLRNEEARGLGIALPSGSTALYAARGGDRLLLGLGRLDDTAAGQRLRIAAGVAGQVTVEQTVPERGRAVAAVTNANAYPVTVEIAIGRADGRRIEALTAALTRVDGVETWIARVPAGGRMELRYGVPERN